MLRKGPSIFLGAKRLPATRGTSKSHHAAFTTTTSAKSPSPCTPPAPPTLATLSKLAGGVSAASDEALCQQYVAFLSQTKATNSSSATPPLKLQAASMEPPPMTSQEQLASLLLHHQAPLAPSPTTDGTPSIEAASNSSPLMTHDHTLLLIRVASPLASSSSSSSSMFSLYDVVRGTVVAARATLGDDGWAFTEQLIANGCSNRILMFVCPHNAALPEDEGALVAEHHRKVADAACTMLTENGVEAFRMDWSEVFGAAPPPLPVDGGAVAVDSSDDTTFFTSVWRRMLHAIAGFPRPLATPVETLLYYIVPMSAIRIIHVVSPAVSNAVCAPQAHITVTALNPAGATSAPSFYRGTISDILQRMQLLPSPIIWVPTYRSCRKSLMILRHALQQAGKRPCIVYPSDLRAGASQTFFGSNLNEYWSTFVSTGTREEALLAIRRAAGGVLRRLAEEAVDVSPAKVESLRAEFLDGTTSSSDVQSWVSLIMHNPARLAIEVKFRAQNLSKPLYISWTATDQPSYGRPANPTDIENYIRTLRLSDPFAKLSWESPLDCKGRGHARLPDLTPYSVLVLHNAKSFLLLMAGDPMLDAFLRRGGRVWCVALAHYLLSAQQYQGDHKLSLPNLAVYNGVCVIAPPDVFANGCCPTGTTFADLKRHMSFSDEVLTNIFASQVDKAVDRRQLINIGHRMESLLACTEIEHPGLHIDAAVAEELDVNQRNEIIEMETVLLTYVPRSFPTDMMRHFDWASLHHLRSYLIGGSIPLGGADDEGKVSAVATQGWMFRYLAFLEHHLVSFSTVSAALAAFANRQLQVSSIATLEEKMSAVKTWYEQQKALQLAAPVQKTPKRGKSATPSNNEIAKSCQLQPTFRVVVFDLESTGLNITTDEIVEIGMWDPVLKKEFSSLINPKRTIPLETVDIHKITQEMTDASPPMADIAESLLKFLRLTESTRRPGEILVLVSHNSFSLDEPLLRRTMRSYTQDSTTSLDDILFCDTVAIFKSMRQSAAAGRIHLPQHIRDALMSLKLGNLAKSLGVASEGNLHRAIVDAKMLWGVLRGVLGIPPAAGNDVAVQALLQAAKSTVLHLQSANCFIPPPKPVAHVRLTGKLNSSKRWRPFRKAAESALTSTSSLIPLLKKLDRAGLEEAAFIHRKLFLEANTASSLLLPSADGTSRVMAQHPRDQCIHPLVELTGTSTTRTSSSFPSAHTFPKSNKSESRRMLVSRFGPESGRMIEVDYSQLEIMVMAVLSKDEQMLLNIRNGVDFHIMRAAQYSGESYESIAERIAKGDASAKEMRQKAKQFSFQRLYGAGTALIHKTTGIPLPIIKQSIVDEHKRYPGIQNFNRLVRCVALRPGNPGLPSHFEFELPTGTRVGFAPRDCVHNLPPLKNYPIQAYGADLVQMMLGKWYRHMLSKNNYNNRAFLVNFVHDSVWLDAHIDVADEVTIDATTVLSSVREVVRDSFGGTVDIPVDFKCTVSTGPSLYHM
jgi:DNA polymerase I